MALIDDWAHPQTAAICGWLMPCCSHSSKTMAFQSIGGPRIYSQTDSLARGWPMAVTPTLDTMAKLVDLATERSDFGDRLYRARLRAKMSQKDLATAAEMAQATLSQLEKTGHGSSKVATLAELTGVRVQWLARGEGPMLDTSEVPAPAEQVASEKVAHFLVGTPQGSDYRAIALSLAAALDETGTEISVQQFMKLLEATYAKLRPDPERQRVGL